MRRRVNARAGEMSNRSEGNLPRGVIFALARGRIRTLRQLRSASDDELLDIRGIGPGHLELIRNALDAIDIDEDMPVSTLDPFAQRDAQMVRLAEKGEMLTEIAAKFDLSADRVSQIVARAKRERRDANDDERNAS